ncbi:uncharacterized protein [Narcine bancroftii]|uniref:uncharacterized protein n=1 Tax=Narcine bancroftii TaxID=1343680 RepID=UPI003831C74B
MAIDANRLHLSFSCIRPQVFPMPSCIWMYSRDNTGRKLTRYMPGTCWPPAESDWANEAMRSPPGPAGTRVGVQPPDRIGCPKHRRRDLGCIRSNYVRQRLLKQSKLDLKRPINLAKLLEIALCNVEANRPTWGSPSWDADQQATGPLLCPINKPTTAAVSQGYCHLLARAITTSRTTNYNSWRKHQVERENSTVWKAIFLALKSRGLPVSHWHEILPEMLHTTQSLLCTATNTTLHERIFSFPRKSVLGTTLPSWLSSPGPILLQKHVKGYKTDPTLVKRVQLLHMTPPYMYVAYPDGHEETVSIQDLTHKAPPTHPPTPRGEYPPSSTLLSYFHGHTIHTVVPFPHSSQAVTFPADQHSSGGPG